MSLFRTGDVKISMKTAQTVSQLGVAHDLINTRSSETYETKKILFSSLPQRIRFYFHLASVVGQPNTDKIDVVCINPFQNMKVNIIY